MAQSDWYQDDYGVWRQWTYPQEQWQENQWQPEWQPEVPWQENHWQPEWQPEWKETQNFDPNNQNNPNNSNNQNNENNANSQATEVLEQEEEEEEEEEEETFYLLSHAARDPKGPKAFFYTDKQIYHVLENGQRLQTGRYRRRDKVLFPVLSTFCGDDSYGYDIPTHLVNQGNRVPNISFTRRQETADYEGIYKCWQNTPDRMYDLPEGPINLQQIIKFLDANHNNYTLTIIGCRGNQNDPYVRFKTDWEPNMIQAKSNESFNRDCLYLGDCPTVYGGSKKLKRVPRPKRIKTSKRAKQFIQKKHTRRLNAVA
jgi:hypothetical protein